MLLLAYLGGVLTILSPCILPVLPFVFARADRPFARSTLPMLAGMALAFAAVGTLAAVAGGWAVEANRAGRDVALVLLALFGVTLLWPRLAERWARPLVALGGRLAASADAGAGTHGVWSSVLLGVATGLLWAPCAGPVLGLILGTAALQGASAHTTMLLLAYALGAATSLAVALLAGGRVFAAMKRSLHAGEAIRKVLGVAVLAAVVAIALGVDTGLLTRVSLAGTNRVEQWLIDRVAPQAGTGPGAAMAAMKGGAMIGGAPAMQGGAMMGGAPAMNGGAMMPGAPAMKDGAMMSGDSAMKGGSAMSGGAMMAAGGSMRAAGADADLAPENIDPTLAGGGPWFNSAPLTMQALRGKVVLIDFWTYSCINCLREIPYVRAWAARYAAQGLVIIGVHTPEFAFEKSESNVRDAVKKLNIGYPVVMDSNYAIWRAFNNQYWPALYFIDAKGQVRHHHFGEGGYDESEQVIRKLLAEAGHAPAAGDASVAAAGIEAASNQADVLSPETYVGYDRAENFVSPDEARDAPHDYQDGKPRLNEWGLSGNWTLGPEHATLNKAGGGITFGFHARDLHLVLGPAGAGKRIRFQVTIDGKPPGADHGVDTDAQGNGVVDGQRLYQLIRQHGAVGDRRFEIHFLDPGVQAFSFTFG